VDEQEVERAVLMGLKTVVSWWKNRPSTSNSVRKGGWGWHVWQGWHSWKFQAKKLPFCHTIMAL